MRTMSVNDNLSRMLNLKSTFSILLTGILASTLYFFVRLYRVRRFYRDLPKPPHSFFWGHLKLMGEISAELPPNVHPQQLYTLLARKYDLGAIFYLDLWPMTGAFVVLRDPALMDQVTVTRALPQHPMVEDFLRPMLGHSIIAAINGTKWKKLHNAMAPAFSWSHIRDLTGVMIEECQHFRTKLDEYAETGQVFSMEDTASALIFDVIARAVFNYSLHAQTEGSQHLSDLKEMVALAERQVHVDYMLNPFAQFSTYLKRRRLLKRLHPSIVGKIEERLKVLQNEKVIPSIKNPNSILDLMLREQVQAGAISEDGKPVQHIRADEMEVLRNNIKGLLIGGQGTTTDSLCYIYMLLSKAPEVVAEMRKECDSVFDKDYDKTVEILLESPEKLQSIPYTEAVIKEGLRLFPVGFGVRAAAERGATLTYEGREYPIGSDLALCSNAHDLQYNPEYFSEPAKFHPDRWLDPSHEIPRSHFRTFSRGARACLGQNLAMNELKVILVLTIRDYDFECANLKPNSKPRTSYTDLDTVFGDIIFQELGIEAKPRKDGTNMRVRKAARHAVA